ncbi:MAG: tetratricopeptide repeat protein [Bryobacteraceae bacterium]
MRARLLRWVAAGVAVAGCGTAAVWSARAGLADYWARQETAAATQRAIALTPGQSLYRFRLAVLLADQDPPRSDAALHRALALNPADADSWIELGLRSEAGGDYSAAERCFQRAAGESKLYLPRWTLANYYYRRNDTARFWQWANRSAEMLYGDPAPLFELCERAAEDGDPAEHLQLRNPDLRASYLSYLMSRREIDRVAAGAESLLAAGRPSDAPLLLASCGLLLEGKQVDGALRIWNGLAAARRIPFAALAPDGGPVLTNSGFATSPTSRGFDWRLTSLEGVSAAREEDAGGLRLTFTGEQPERCEPLTQFVPVRENQAYELRFAYRTSGIAPDTGPRWQVAGGFGSGAIAESEALSSPDTAEGRVRFTTPAGCRLLRLALVYQRAPGTTRIEGYVVLRGVWLDLQAKPRK